MLNTTRIRKLQLGTPRGTAWPSAVARSHRRCPGALGRAASKGRCLQRLSEGFGALGWCRRRWVGRGAPQQP